MKTILAKTTITSDYFHSTSYQDVLSSDMIFGYYPLAKNSLMITGFYHPVKDMLL